MRYEEQFEERIPTPLIPGTLYTLQDFQAATGMKKTALRTARERGLKVRYVGNRGFILADDFLEYVQAEGKESESKK